jgi:hypothetical protein
VFSVRERVEMPPPGDTRPALLSVSLTDRIWNAMYAPISGVVEKISEELNRLQFLTIRRYLSLVFAALVILLVMVTLWN